MSTRTDLLEWQRKFEDASKVIRWNKWILMSVGLWPNQPSDFIFMLNYVYFAFHMMLEYLDLCMFIGDLEHVVMNLTENMVFSQILIRMAMLRRYNYELGIVFNDLVKDYDSNNYKSTEENQIFIKYNNRSKLFIKLINIFLVLTASSYFVKPLMGNPPEELSVGLQENLSATYELPYRFYLFYKVEDSRTYVLTYASWIPFVIISCFGQSASDCLMVTLAFHVCGQLGVLAIRIRNISSNEDLCGEELRNIVKHHNKLLKMGQTIEEAFSDTLLGHLLGATTLVCVLGFQILTNFSNGQNAELMTFIIFATLVLLILFAFCSVGECLLTESFNVCDSFYNCEWFEMPSNKARFIIMCMARSQRPLCLKTGKFGIFCLSTLTDVLKTAMGYLSVIRTFL